MRVPIVRHGDETTTRGKVVALTATIHDDGRKIALHGDQATCGNCKGLWNIVGTGKGVGEKGRVAVINGNHVLCPCGKNRVIAGADAGMFIHIDTGTGLPSTNTAGAASSSRHWIAFRVAEYGSCEGLECVAYFEDGSRECGVFDSTNKVRFDRAENASACQHIELLPDSSRFPSGSATEALLSAITG